MIDSKEQQTELSVMSYCQLENVKRHHTNAGLPCHENRHKFILIIYEF